MIKNASKKSEVESEKIIKKYHKASSLKINTCFNALYEINHDKDEISPIPKKSLTPKHINYRKEKFHLIITQSIEFSTAIIDLVQEMNHQVHLQDILSQKRIFF